MSIRILRDTPEVIAMTTTTDMQHVLFAYTAEGREFEVGRPLDGEPFTDADVDQLLASLGEKPHLEPGERRRTRRKHLTGTWWLYTHVNTGPPTWWLPRVKFERYGVMVGWFRGLVAVAVRRETRACDSCGTRGPVRYSPFHGAHFCPTCHGRENPSQQ